MKSELNKERYDKEIKFDEYHLRGKVTFKFVD